MSKLKRAKGLIGKLVISSSIIENHCLKIIGVEWIKIEHTQEFYVKNFVFNMTTLLRKPNTPNEGLCFRVEYSDEDGNIFRPTHLENVNLWYPVPPRLRNLKVL